MEVWSGPITGVGDISQGKGISLLVEPRLTGQCPLRKDAQLSLRAFVNPSLIPYYARLGPALKVYVKDFEMIEWWKCRLLKGVYDEHEEKDGLLDGSLPIQCPTGMLLAVEEPQRCPSAASGSDNDVTDILVYGELCFPSLHSKRSPSPPLPSPAFPNDNLGASNDNKASTPERELRIYAVMLCSGLITKAEALISPPLTPKPGPFAYNDDGNGNDDNNDHGNEKFAEFFPEHRSPCPKRKRMASIFDAATEYHKKVRRKGGEAVAQLMSRRLSSVAAAAARQLPNSANMKIKKESSNISAFNDNNISSKVIAHKPRTLSISRIMKVPKQPSPATPRNPTSNIGARPRTANVSSRTSTPATLPPQQQQQQDTQKSQPQLTSASPTEIIATNKALLTRTILTCMRLYGFHRNSRTSNPVPATGQSKRSSQAETADADSLVVPPTKTAMILKESQSHSRPSTAIFIPAAASPEIDDDDDFKAMYQATYRAASFALRRYLKDVLNGSAATGSSVVAGEDGLIKASHEVTAASVPILEREKATDLVDGLLRLFCET
ncbi:hypothetical protein I7I51_02374 [Histoplasma capsulatum]|uniref:Sld7 C-terminal domain-containing protein n=2 Tax=Histoplasma TaxID=5036 RepID=A0A8A1MA50_AJECA|nr:hypothetical protein I7I51_02374 [Histoplasma capsulatum]